LIRKTGREDWPRRRAGASLVQVYSSMHKGAPHIFILPSLGIIKYVIVFFTDFKHLNFHEWLNMSKLNNGTGTYDVTKLFPILKYLGIFVSQSYPKTTSFHQFWDSNIPWIGLWLPWGKTMVNNAHNC
jgi:hypothetical protein